MIGNQVIINSVLLEHEKNPIKEAIGDKEPLDIIYIINDEFWKQWRRDLTHSDNNYIKQPGLGVYSLMYGKSKNYLRKILAKIRRIKTKNPDTYLTEGTRANGMYVAAIERFRNTWKQVDRKKKEVNANEERWKQKKIAKYGDKAIL